MEETKDSARERILDAAEVVFAQQGYDAATMRAITQAAGANIASVNYYFGSKDGLFIETVRRRVEPVNQERFKLLDEHRKSSEEPLTVEQVVHALLYPMAKIIAQPSAFKLMGRCMTERREIQRKVYENFFFEVGKTFLDALREALPECAHSELVLRFHFTVSLMVGALLQHERLEYLLPQQSVNQGDRFLQRLANFMVAGLKTSLQTPIDTPFAPGRHLSPQD